MNRCTSLTPTKKMKRQHNDEIKLMFRKFAFNEGDKKASEGKASPRLQETEQSILSKDVTLNDTSAVSPKLTTS